MSKSLNKKLRKQLKNTEAKTALAPTSIATKQKFKVSSSYKPRSKRFRNSELVASISGSVAFANTAYALNPGLSATFPWLSQEALKWEQYRFYSLCFRYVTRSPTTASGSVILSPDYDAQDSAPTSEVIATDSQDAVEDAIWKELRCELDPSAMFPLGPRKYVRQGNTSSNRLNYDAGILNVGTIGEADTSQIGKLWVDYDVEFYVPQNTPSGLNPIPSTISYGIKAGTVALSTGVNYTVAWDAWTVDALGIGNAAAGLFTPPRGAYLVFCQADFQDTIAENLTLVMAVNQNGVALTPPAISGNTALAAVASNVHISCTAVVSCSGTDTISIVVSATGGAGNLTLVGNRNYLWMRPV